MNYIEFYTDSDRIIEEADREFEVITTLPPAKGGEWDKEKIGVFDRRAEKHLRRELRQIYNRVEHTV